VFVLSMPTKSRSLVFKIEVKAGGNYFTFAIFMEAILLKGWELG
jgi:hypothetical protein